MNTPEIPPPPKTPRVNLHGNGWAVSIPAAVVVALITIVGNRFVMPVPTEEIARLREDVRELQRVVGELTRTQAALLAAKAEHDEAKRNAALIEALRAGKAP